MKDPKSLLPLTPLSFHLLLALAEGDKHGYGLMKEVKERTEGSVNPATGTVYLALQRLEDAGMVGDGGLETPPDGGVSRRRWTITTFGKEVAAAEAKRLVGLVGQAVDNNLLNIGILSDLIERADHA